MSITFSGLATGLDTDSIVSQLMDIERYPITSLEADKTWLESREASYAALDGKLQNFLSKIENLGTSDDLIKKSATSSSDEFFSVTAEAGALANSSYQVEVVSLAQVQKNVSQGYATRDTDSFGVGELTLNVGDEDPVVITIDESNNSLNEIVEAINNADAGVNASIINDGTDSPYRVVLTGEAVATSFSVSSDLPSFNGDLSTELVSGGFASETTDYFGSGTLVLSTGDTITLSDETNSLTDIMTAINDESGATGITASIVADGDNFVLSLSGGATFTSTDLSGGYDNPFSFIETQGASQAHIRVDSIDIYSDGNTLDEAIPGLSLDLLQAEEGTTSTVSVSLNEDLIKSQINDFVTGYNDVLSYIGSQFTSTDGDSGGLLSGNAEVSSLKRRLQTMLTTMIGESGGLSALSQLGIETQRDGTVELDDDALTDAIQNNLESVEYLLVGDDDVDGIAVMFQDYLEGMTDSIDGMYASNKASTESNVKRIDDRIEQIETRLEKKELTMRNKFTALESLISSMNSESSFLTQQMDMLNNMITGNN